MIEAFDLDGKHYWFEYPDGGGLTFAGGSFDGLVSREWKRSNGVITETFESDAARAVATSPVEFELELAYMVVTGGAYGK